MTARPPVHDLRDEVARRRTSQALRVFDTLSEERFGRFTRLARRLFRVPVVAIRAVDAELRSFEARVGLEALDTLPEFAFSEQDVRQRTVLEVADMRDDPGLASLPIVAGQRGLRFHAACPLVGPDGRHLATLHLLDRDVRRLDSDDLGLLRDLAAVVEQDLTNCALASTDELTGLSNRRGFMALAERALALCRRMSEPAYLVYLDLDGFKQVNDRFGHEQGDAALCGMAQILLEGFRDSDVMGRIGGDEFCVLLVGAAEVKPPFVRLESRLQAWNAAPGRLFPLSYSLGYVGYEPARHGSLADMMREADARMFERKRQRAAAATPGP